MIRVLIVEDHPAIGAGLQALLGDEPDFDVVGAATGIAMATELIRTSQPDVVLCDVMMDGADRGLDLLRQSRGAARFLMFSAYVYPSVYNAALEAGAAGYLPKTATIDEIGAAVRAIAEGGRAFPPAVLISARHALPPPSTRELQAIALIARGATNRQIATALTIQLKTVESLLRRLFDRYDVTNRTELASLARREGWLVGDSARDDGA